ncbi:MAG: helicase-related protein [Terracidiphilus sp.]
MVVSNQNTEETLLAEYLVATVRDFGTGASAPECNRNYPRDVYFIGNLRSVQTALRAAPVGSVGQIEMQTKIAPFAMGGQFRIQPPEQPMVLETEVSWSVYYRVFPSLDQQRKHLQQAFPAADPSQPPESAAREEAVEGSSEADATVDAVDDGNEPADEDDSGPTTDSNAPPPPAAGSGAGRRTPRAPNDSLFIRFRKVSCATAAQLILTRDPSGTWAVDTGPLRTALDREMQRAVAVAVAMADPQRIRTSGNPATKIQVPVQALQSQAAYRSFLSGLTVEVPPSWAWIVNTTLVEQSETDNSPLLFSLELVNASLDDGNPHREPFIFDTRFCLTFPSNTLLPFELDLAPRGFRYDRLIWGRGFNCGLERDASAPSTISSTHIPTYRQPRLTTQTEPAALFDELSSAPLPVLDRILSAMEAYRQTWQQRRATYCASDPSWEARYGQEFDLDFGRFDEEIRRFRRGIELLRQTPDALLAFCLTNKTFFRAGSGRGRDRWRLFQIVFIVSQLPGIIALTTSDSADMAEREVVDIVYFPTGGGKTEAYLGALVFHCFFDRLRGKRLGVTAWTRFPLRLLTLQQTQRIADIIGIADLVRRSHSDPRLHSPDVDGFSIGYFVGEGGSPNEIANPQLAKRVSPEIEASWAKANDPRERQEWKRVIYCPACRTKSVRIDFDPSTVRVLHVCSNPSCAFPSGHLPVIVVDNEIYRYLPTVIVGTIDKLAVIGNQRKFSQLFGRVDGRCRLHGFYKGKCSQKDCTNPRLLDMRVPANLTGPSLFIQDELHLLKEGLGTFDGHYETFLQRLRRDFGDTAPLKIIASSATVEAFERQIQHLYGRDPSQARVFPGLGPTLTESFYIETQAYPQRLYVGILPHNKTLFNTVLELIEAYHRAIDRMERLPSGAANPFGGTLSPGTAAWASALDLYRTSLTYFLAQRDLDSVANDIEGDLNPNLEQDQLPALNKLELKGSTRTDDVTRILERLETAAPGAAPDCVLATSMISHGVDIDRLNAMLFYGMPRQTAEYIQASSRVGRSHVGVVLTLLHPIRERDRSHFSYFAKYHEYLGRLVEPVAINRWARFSVNRTLPGLFMAILLQRLASAAPAGTAPERYYMLDFLRQRIADGSIRAADFVSFLEEAYQVSNATSVGELTFQGEIRLRVQQFLDQIVAAGSSTFVSEALIPKPMRSLRDVDEQIGITLDDDGSNWATRQRQV